MGTIVGLCKVAFKVGLAFGLVVGTIGIGGFVAVCTVSADVPCSIDTGSGTSSAAEPDDPSPDRSPSNTSEQANSPDSPDSTDSGGGTTDDSDSSGEDGGTDEEQSGPEEPGDEERITGQEPPDYPERTDKDWDRELRFGGDPGETVARGDNWEVRSEHVERFVATKVNDYRVEQGLDRLEYSHALAGVSREHSADMARRDFFAHENPDGERAWDRWGSGDCRSWYGENLFQTWANANLAGEPEPLRTAEGLGQQTLEGWQNSPPHHEAMREAAWDAVGYGVYFDADSGDPGQYKVFVTMNMCTYNENERP